MNWPPIKRFTHVEIGLFLTLMIVVMQPIFSPRLPSILLVLMSGWLIWNPSSRLFASSAIRRLLVIFALLWIPMLISIPESFDPRYSMKVAFAVAFYSLAGLAIIHVLRDDARRRWLAKWISAAMILWIADGMIQYLFGQDLLGYPLTADGRLTGFFRGNPPMSSVLAIFLPISAWYLMRKYPLGVLAMFVACGIVAVLVATRNALMLLLVAAGATWLRMPRRHWLALIVALVVIVGSISFSPKLKERLERTADISSATFEAYDNILSGRLIVWETASHMLIDRPLNGVGVGMFAIVYDHYSSRPNDPFLTGGTSGGGFHAHNVYMSIAAETGWPGLLGIILAFILCVKWYYAAPPHRREQAWPYATALLIAVFPLSSEYGIYKHSIYPVVLLLLCATLAALEGGATDEKPHTENSKR